MDPFTLLMLAGAIAGGTGSIINGNKVKAQARRQKRIAGRNAELAIEAGRDEEKLMRSKMTNAMRENLVEFAKDGIFDVTSGSIAAVQDFSAKEIEDTSKQIMDNAFMRANSIIAGGLSTAAELKAKGNQMIGQGTATIISAIGKFGQDSGLMDSLFSSKDGATKFVSSAVSGVGAGELASKRMNTDPLDERMRRRARTPFSSPSVSSVGPTRGDAP